jgi:cell division protein FtsN
MSKKPASLTSDLLARKGEAEPSSIDPAARMTPSAGPDFPPYGSGGFGGHDGGGRPRPPEPEIIYTAEETRSGGGNTRLVIGAVLGIIVIGGILLTLSSRTDRGVAPVSPNITAEQAPAPSAVEPSAPAAPETVPATPAPQQPEAAQQQAAAPETPPAAPQAATPETAAPQAVVPQATAPAPAPAAPESPAEASAPEAASPAPTAEEAAPVEKRAAAAKPASKGAFVLQLQSLRDEKSARASWAHLTKRYAALSGHALDIEKADLGDKGVWYRVRAAGFATKAAAASTCAKLKSAGQDCIVKKR